VGRGAGHLWMTMGAFGSGGLSLRHEWMKVWLGGEVDEGSRWLRGGWDGVERVDGEFAL